MILPLVMWMEKNHLLNFVNFSRTLRKLAFLKIAAQAFEAGNFLSILSFGVFEAHFPIQIFLIENVYAKTLFVAGVWYLVRERKFFTVTRSKGWSKVVLMVRLLFTVAVTNATLERMFPRLKHVKTNFRCSLCVKRLEK